MKLIDWIIELKKINKHSGRTVKVPKSLRPYWKWEVVDNTIKGHQLMYTSTRSCTAKNGVQKLHVKEIPINVWEVNTKLVFTIKDAKPEKGFQW